MYRNRALSGIDVEIAGSTCTTRELLQKFCITVGHGFRAGDDTPINTATPIWEQMLYKIPRASTIVSRGRGMQCSMHTP